MDPKSHTMISDGAAQLVEIGASNHSPTAANNTPKSSDHQITEA
jgi:hypothetical protein